MRRFLDAFSKREKSSTYPPPPPSPSYLVPLRSGTNSLLSEFAPSGNSTCSSDQSSNPPIIPLSPDTYQATKPRGLLSWLHTRRGRKQTSVSVEDPILSTQSFRKERNQRSRSQSDSRTKLSLPSTPSENLLPVAKQDRSRVPLLRSQSAMTKARPKDQTMSSLPTANVSHKSNNPPQEPSLQAFCDFIESTLDPLGDAHPHIPNELLVFPTSMTPHTSYISKPSLRQKTLSRNCLSWTKQHPSDPRLMSIASRHWSQRAARKETPEALLARGAVQPGCVALLRWAERPCFEERCSEIIAEGADLQVRPISGGQYAVAALEYSESLDLLASIPSVPLVLHSEDVTTTSAPTFVQEPELISPMDSEFSDTSVTPRAPSQGKRGVRFQAKVEEVEPDDLVPLAVTLRAHQKKAARRRTLLLEEEKLVQKALREAERAEKAKKESNARRKGYAAEVAATRERRETQRQGFQPQRSSIVSSSSSASIASMDKNFYGRLEGRRSSTSLQVVDTSLRPKLPSRPASYTSSGESSPNPFSNDRGSSTTSLPQFGGSSRSVSSSADSVPRSRQHSRERVIQHSRERSAHSAQTSRSRKSSTSAKRQSNVPPVPFLARPWNVPEVHLPPANMMMQQGPFLASIRTQGAYLQPTVQPNFYVPNAVPVAVLPSTQHTILPRTHSATAVGNKTFNNSNRRVSSYGPTRSHSYSAQTS